jgi:hypothetical protein
MISGDDRAAVYSNGAFAQDSAGYDGKHHTRGPDHRFHHGAEGDL